MIRSEWNRAARARRPRRCGAALLLAGVLCAGCSVGGPRPIPLHSRAEFIVERLDALGLADSHFSGTRPYSVGDLYRLLDEGEDNVRSREARSREARPGEPHGTAGPLDAPFRDLAENAKVLGFAEDEETLGADGWLTLPTQFPTVTATWISGSPRTENLADSPSPVTYGPGRIVNDFGRDYGDGGNLHVGFRSTVQVGEWLVVSMRPEFQFIDELPGTGESDSDLRFLEANARLLFGPWELEIGRDSLWWGPGRDGSLLLSNNAAPFDLVKFSNREPVLLPGFLRYVGPVRVTAFATRLEKNRTISEPVFAGMRLEFKPHRNLTVGASRTFIFGGGSRSEDLNTIRDVLFVRDENDPGGASDQLASIDLRYRFRIAGQPLVLYVEQGGEDEAGNLPSRHAYLAGLHLPRMGRLPVQLRVEYANTHVSQVADYWYSHNIYRDGYTYKGRIIGHHIGTDAEETSVELGVPLPYGGRVALRVRQGRRNLSASPKEDFLSYGFDLNWPLGRRGMLRAAYFHESYKDFQLKRGAEDNVDYGILSVVLPF